MTAGRGRMAEEGDAEGEGAAAVAEGSAIGGLSAAIGEDGISGEDDDPVEIVIDPEDTGATLAAGPPAEPRCPTRKATVIPIARTVATSAAATTRARFELRRRRSGIGGVLCRPEVGDGVEV